MEELVSLIVPVHNSSKYLENCLKSILNQTYKSIEIIAIENGSKDNSLEILNQYKTKIKIEILKEAGIGLARNKGIQISKGKYIAFIDSDDTVEKNFIEELVKSLEKNNSDLSCCNITEIHESTNKVVKRDEYPRNEINQQEIYQNIHKFNYAIWNKLYKKEILIKNNITFPLGLKYEDVPFVLAYLTHTKKISKVNKYLYNYLIHSESEQTTIDKRIFHIIDIMNLCKNKIDLKYLENLYVATLTTYALKARHLKDKTLRENFIKTVYKNLNDSYPFWKKCEYLKERNILKRQIQKSETLTKIYTCIYSKTH